MPRDSISLVVRRLGSFSNTPRSRNCLVFRRVGSLSYVSRAKFCLVVCRVGSLPYTPCPGICLVVRLEESFSHTPRATVCLVVKRVGSFSYTSDLGILKSVLSFVGRRVSLTRPVLVSGSYRVSGQFLLHAPLWNLCVRSADRGSLLAPRTTICLVVRRVGSLSYTPHVGNCLVFRRVESVSD